MNKYKNEIDRILSLIYEGEFLGFIDSDYGNIVADRIGVDNGDINIKILNIHYHKVCGEITNCDKCEIKLFCRLHRKSSLNSIKPNSLSFVDLFCGAGGFSVGFCQSGLNPVLAIDIEPWCTETYRINHPNVKEDSILNDDIEASLPIIYEKLESENISVVIGGPPCQGFSMANRQPMINDPRNKLYKYFVDAISTINPKFFVMENVEGILKIKSEIIEDFSKLKTPYNVIAFKINAIDFGVPQQRKRVLFIGTRTDCNLDELIDEIIAIGKQNYPTVLDQALNGMKVLKHNSIKHSTEIESGECGNKIDLSNVIKKNCYIDLINPTGLSKITFNHRARYNNSRDIEIFSRLNQGDRSDDPKIADIMPYSSRNHIFKDKYFRLQSNKPSKTITAHMKYDCNMYIHPTQNRGLSPREAARIQSFPDNYYFAGPFTKTYMQIGNSVPPLVARAVAKAISNRLFLVNISNE